MDAHCMCMSLPRIRLVRSSVMDRVLKRVGLSRGCSERKATSVATVDKDDNAEKARRRRRSRSRRRHPQDAKKTRGLFNIDWESVRDCKSCKSRAITRRLCSKRCDNELYRSNSFKFERFVRGNEESSTLGKKISLCDDYSLPVDHVNKKRPNSFAAPSISEWNVSSPNEEQVEILDTYSNPRDSKSHISQTEEADETKYYTSPDREYSQPYTTDGSSEPSSDEEYFGHESVVKHVELNSPDSITEAILPLVNVPSPERTDIKRHPSPYYYADLYKVRQNDQQVTQTNKWRKSGWCNGGTTGTNSESGAGLFEGSSVGSRSIAPDGDVLRPANDNERLVAGAVSMPPNRLMSPCSCLVVAATTAIHDGPDDDDMTRQRHVYETAFDCRVSRSDDDLDQIDRLSNHPVLVQLNGGSRRQPTDQTRSKTNEPPPQQVQQPQKPEPDNRALDAVAQNLKEMHISNVTVEQTPHILPLRGYTISPPSTAPLPTKFHGKQIVMNSVRSAPSLPSNQQHRLKDLRLPVKSLRGRMKSGVTGPGLSADNDLNIDANVNVEMSESNRNTLVHGADVDSEERCSSSKGSVIRPRTTGADVRLHEIKARSRKESSARCAFTRQKEGHSRSEAGLEYKNCRRRIKYSSTESMATTTSSSGGSMESLRSSTSEGNRSTTSSEGRHSTSLSSHSSDSGSVAYHLTQSSGFLTHANKLHILSPISDKSSQEPASETSDNTRNNNSQKCSPDECSPTPPPTAPTTQTLLGSIAHQQQIVPTIAVTATTTILSTSNSRIKRRPPQNKNLLNVSGRVGDAEIQGSDSGISIRSSRGDDNRYRFGFVSELGAPDPDLTELPFDMPKLRRKRLVEQDICTSGSTTSVDLRDLPFDMPKLRRRLRIPPQASATGAMTGSSVSQASSSQSMLDTDKQVALVFRPRLTLNLGSGDNDGDSIGCITSQRRSHLGGLGLGLGLAIGGADPASGADLIDTSLPLERQGWYHGAITRIEAECVLRLLREGSFLVRNSESTKQDYSLSLKSARGFMHMRIQRNNADGSFVLGQFSKPFHSIPEMIRHFSLNRLPVRGAEHMCLIQPVIAQLL